MPGWRSNRAPSRLKTSLQNKRRENAHYKEQSMKLPIFLLLTTLLPFTALTLHADDEGQDTRPIVCIESKKIQNKTDNPRANFSALVDRLNHELTQSGIYRVMDMKDLAAVHVDTEKFAVAADDGGNQNPDSRIFRSHDHSAVRSIQRKTAGCSLRSCFRKRSRHH